MTTLNEFNRRLLSFLDSSPTPFHVVENMCALLEQRGFTEICEHLDWNLRPGERYFVTRNGSSLIAFVLGRHDLVDGGIRIVGAHTDSPCLRVKPLADITDGPYLQVGVEVYGTALLNPWFDRDLSLAGRVTYRTRDGEMASTSIDFRRPIGVIPSLAIHLDRNVNQSRRVNPQRHLAPIVLIQNSTTSLTFDALLKHQIKSQQSGCDVETVLTHELSFYDVQPPAIVGINDEFITGGRLDNLLSCYTGLEALLTADGDVNCLLVCNDHEEVGSASACGAQGPFLKAVLERLVANPADLTRTLDRSLMISADNAHAAHPNYIDKHDPQHWPVLNGGPVIKINANQRYATNSESAAVFRHICMHAEVPVQTFVSRNDMACGTTIGPITASEIGVNTVDVGVPQFAMHSPREMAGADDCYQLNRALAVFYRSAAMGIRRSTKVRY